MGESVKDPPLNAWALRGVSSIHEARWVLESHRGVSKLSSDLLMYLEPKTTSSGLAEVLTQDNIGQDGAVRTKWYSLVLTLGFCIPGKNKRPELGLFSEKTTCALL